jgi:hypothetical protein
MVTSLKRCPDTNHSLQVAIAELQFLTAIAELQFMSAIHTLQIQYLNRNRNSTKISRGLFQWNPPKV